MIVTAQEKFLYQNPWKSSLVPRRGHDVPVQSPEQWLRWARAVEGYREPTESETAVWVAGLREAAKRALERPIGIANERN